MSTQKHTGPAPSEQALFKLWDQVEAARTKHGERVAAQLATKALAAIEPVQAPDQKQRPAE